MRRPPSKTTEATFHRLLGMLLLLLPLARPAVADVRTVAAPEGVSITAGGLTVGTGGDLYSADFGGATVLRIGLDGMVTTFATGFNTPSGNQFDSQGNLYQSNYRDNINPLDPDTISRVTPNGMATTWAEGLNGPVGIAIDAEDTLFVAMCNANSIVRIAQDRVPATLASSSLFDCPNGITFDDRGILYVVNYENGDLLRVTRDGDVSLVATIPGGGNGHVAYISGSLFVATHAGHQIYEVKLPNGKVSLLAGDGVPGQVDGPNLTARFATPNGVARNAVGDELYINEFRGVVRAIDLTFKRPKQPKSVKARAKRNGKAKVTWSFRSRNVESFRVEAREAGGAYESLAEVSSATSKAVIRGLKSQTTYEIRVVAINPSGERASKAVRLQTKAAV